MEDNDYLDSYEQNAPNEENNNEKTIVKDMNTFSDKLLEKLLSFISQKEAVSGIVISKDGQIITASRDQSIKVWE